MFFFTKFDNLQRTFKEIYLLLLDDNIFLKSEFKSEFKNYFLTNILVLELYQLGWEGSYSRLYFFRFMVSSPNFTFRRNIKPFKNTKARNYMSLYLPKFQLNNMVSYLLNSINTNKSNPYYFFTKFLNAKKSFYDLVKRSFGFGFTYLYGFVLILFIDACITDDEPLWEPIEWSLVQSWILFIFIFSWVAENLIVSRYGSYVGRDKRVWMAWYKTFWLIEGFYIFNYGVTCVFIIVPFYYETNYNLSFVYSWWHWYSRIFFYKFIAIYSIILILANILQTGIRWLNWKKLFLLVTFITAFLSYLIYTHFIITFFGYFTDPIWYQKVRPIDYIQLSHEPARWGWGSAKKDHFTYHNVKTVFWFKNDGPFASSFLFFHLFLFICLFLTYTWWIILLRKIFTTREIPLTFLTYCTSSLRQFFYFFLWIYFFIFLSYMSNYWRLPIDMFSMLNSESWLLNFTTIVLDYPFFLFSIFFN